MTSKILKKSHTKPNAFIEEALFDKVSVCINFQRHQSFVNQFFVRMVTKTNNDQWTQS